MSGDRFPILQHLGAQNVGGHKVRVNWTRRSSIPNTVPMVSTSRVLPRPGTPISSM